MGAIWCAAFGAPLIVHVTQHSTGGMNVNDYAVRTRFALLTCGSLAAMVLLSGCPADVPPDMGVLRVVAKVSQGSRRDVTTVILTVRDEDGKESVSEALSPVSFGMFTLKPGDKRLELQALDATGQTLHTSESHADVERGANCDVLVEQWTASPIAQARRFPVMLCWRRSSWR